MKNVEISRRRGVFLKKEGDLGVDERSGMGRICGKPVEKSSILWKSGLKWKKMGGFGGEVGAELGGPKKGRSWEALQLLGLRGRKGGRGPE